MHPMASGITRERMLDIIERATGVFEALTDDVGLARAFGVTGKLHVWKGECGLAIAALQRSRDHARRGGDRAQEIESVRYLLTAMDRGPTPVEEVVALTEEASVLAETDIKLRATLLGR